MIHSGLPWRATPKISGRAHQVLCLPSCLRLILIFLVLAAQFESFKDPLIVMMTVPLALTGALLFMWYFNITMNIFSQIGIIMLIGLVSKMEFSLSSLPTRENRLVFQDRSH